MQIGGRNLLKGTSDFSGLIVNYAGLGDLQAMKFRGNIVYYVTGDWQGVKLDNITNLNTDFIGLECTVSFYAKTTPGNTCRFGCFLPSTTFASPDVISGDWKQYNIYFPNGFNNGEAANGLIEFHSGNCWYSSFKIEKGNKATDWTPAPEDVEALINQEIQDVENKITGLETTVNTTFKDGIIEEAEAKAIEKYINSLNAEKPDIDNQYNTIYNDALLTGTAKDNLYSQKESYNTAHSQLSSSINTAIEDGKTTPSEKSDVDSKFTNYKNVLGGLAIRLTEALKAIEAKRIDNVQIGG